MSFKLKICKIKCGKITFHIFYLYKFFEAMYQIAYSYSAFLHKIILTIGAAFIFIAA